MPELRIVTRRATEVTARNWRVITPPWTNFVLDSVGWIAITRGVLYGFGAQPTDLIPRGLDLLPEWALYIYGVLWFLVGIFTVYASRTQSGKRQVWAQRSLGSLCAVWAICFFIGSLLPPSPVPGGVPLEFIRTTSLVSMWFYILLARIAFHAESLASMLHKDSLREAV